MKATPKIAMMRPTSVTRLFPRQHSRSVGKSVNDGQAVETFPQPLGKVPFPLLLRHTPRFRDLLRGHGRDQHVVNQGGPISPEFGLLSRIAHLTNGLRSRMSALGGSGCAPPRRKSGFDPKADVFTEAARPTGSIFHGEKPPPACDPLKDMRTSIRVFDS
jgi:hypothetical protein